MSDRIAVMNRGPRRTNRHAAGDLPAPRDALRRSFLGAMNWIGGIGVRPGMPPDFAESGRRAARPAVMRDPCSWARRARRSQACRAGKRSWRRSHRRAKVLMKAKRFTLVGLEPTSCGFPECERCFCRPRALLMLATLVAPLGIVVVYSFLTRGAYGGVEQPFTLRKLHAPVRSSVRRHLPALVLDRRARDGAVPGARISAGAVHRAQRTRARICICSLVILPFWTSFLVRTYAWMFLLRDTGLINTALQAPGSHSRPAADAV